MLSDSDRIINIAPYSVNEFLFYFILFLVLNNLNQHMSCLSVYCIIYPEIFLHEFFKGPFKLVFIFILNYLYYIEIPLILID